METVGNRPRAEAMIDLLRAVLKMSAHAHRAGSAMNKGSGLTNARWILIDEAARSETPLSLSDHARRLGFSRQALKRLADDMVRDGLVMLEPDRRDKRVLKVVLTEDGRRLQQEAFARGLTYNDQVAADLSIEEIQSALATILAATERMIDWEVDKG